MSMPSLSMVRAEPDVAFKSPRGILLTLNYCGDEYGFALPYSNGHVFDLRHYWPADAGWQDVVLQRR